MSQQTTVRIKKSGGPKKRKQLIGPKRNIPNDEYMAASIGDEEWLDLSLSDGRSPTTTDSNGLTPLHLAALHGHLNCIKLLIEKYKVDVNIPSDTGWRPLHLAINKENVPNVMKCVNYLLKQGADINALNYDGTTPLHQAASEGLLDCTKNLIAREADVRLIDVRGHTAFDLAKLWSHRKCARVIQTNMWKDNKHEKAKKMKQLKNVKEQLIELQEEAVQQLHNEQEFYGGVAFGNWLEAKGMSDQREVKTFARERYPEETMEGLDRRLRTHGGIQDCSERMESVREKISQLPQINNKPRPADAQKPKPTNTKQSKVSVSQVISTPKLTLMLSDKTLRQSRVKTSEIQQKVETVNVEDGKKPKLVPKFQDTKVSHKYDWNPSTNLQSDPVTDIKTKDFVSLSIHPDPVRKVLPNRADLNVQVDLKKKPKIKVMLPGGRIKTADISIPRLSRSTLSEFLLESSSNRIQIPQEFCAVHIHDVTKKRRTKSNAISEIGMHLNMLGDARLLYSDRSTKSKSASDLTDLDRLRMLNTLQAIGPNTKLIS